jgi:hypothetical protein
MALASHSTGVRFFFPKKNSFGVEATKLDVWLFDAVGRHETPLTETQDHVTSRAGHPLDRIRTAADRLLITDWPTPFPMNETRKYSETAHLHNLKSFASAAEMISGEKTFGQQLTDKSFGEFSHPLRVLEHEIAVASRKIVVQRKIRWEPL